MGRSTEPVARRADEDVVLRFLHDVRAGRHLDRAARYLAPRVTAYQGPPGGVHPVVVRTPEEYAEHVREMLSAVGPWTLEVLGPVRRRDLVEATWRQTGRVVEHGWARYRVEDDRITEYWIDVHHDVAEPGGALR